MNPQQRSLAWLRDRGFICQTTEQTVRYPDKERPGRWKVFRRDLYGFVDLVGIRGDVLGCTFVQTTAGMSHKGERQQKIEASSAIVPLLLAGNTVELHIWRKLGARGKPKRWSLARYGAHLVGTAVAWNDITEEEFDDEKEKAGGDSSQPALKSSAQ